MSIALTGQLAWFVLVGCAAAATHWAAVVVLVSQAHLAPLLANVGGWAIAFGVSFLGHYHLTFKHQQAPLGQAARRFLAVSALGFALNEAAYAWLLHATPWRYDLVLAVVLVGVAALTFLLSRRWAFQRRR